MARREAWIRVAMLTVMIGACAEDSVTPPLFVSGAGGTGGSGGVPAGAGGSGAAGAGGVAGTVAGMVGGVGATGGSGAIGGVGAMGGVAAMGGSGAIGGIGAMGGVGGTAGIGEPNGPCDISGRWILTTHLVTDAFFAQQSAMVFHYYEIAKQGDGFEIAKMMRCGDIARGAGAVTVEIESEDAWEETRKRVSEIGRPVSSTAVAGGCDVHFGKWVTARGVTLPHYLDLSIPLPTVAQQASADGATPGWEDWDADGQPGVSVVLTGDVQGRLFVSPRIEWEYRATVPNTMTTFRLLIDWKQEQNVMAWMPMEDLTLGLTADNAANPELHFAEAARLTADQATGDDAAICAAIRELAPALTPNASQI
jgi:hypothetical protein